ncbi:MAG: hypothetical protein VKM17_04460 [Cyanobacteriota bacterium]|nr:hypothetical protein [Cyanobacteriota bacterium]
MELPPLPPTPLLQVERAIAPIGFPDPALEQVLRSHLFPPGSNPETCRQLGGWRYVYNRVDLNGDRTPETLVALLSGQGCGKAGCPVLLFQNFGSSLSLLQRIQGFHTTLVVGEGRTQGWHDLIFPPRRVAEPEPAKRLSHDGGRYPDRPLAGGAGDLSLPTKGVAALVLKESPYLVQGYPLSCPVQRGTQRKSVFSKVPMARPTSSFLLVPEGEPPSRPAV